MSTHKKPPDGVVLALINVDNHLIGLTLALEHERPPTPEIITPVLKAIMAHRASVQGNRSDMESCSWSDLRLALAGTLRICLAHLEGVEA